MSATGNAGLKSGRLLSLRALVYFYRRRLRAHGIQELLAGIGIAAAVALVLAAGISQQSIAGSTRQALRAVIGPTNLQLRARGPRGFPEAMLAQVEAIRGVKQAAPLLERTVRIIGAGGRAMTVYVAGTDTSLGVLNGFGRTLPLAADKPGTVALSAAVAHELGVTPASVEAHGSVALLTGGVRHVLPVSSILGGEAVGVLSNVSVAVMPLTTMQALVGEPGMVSRILVRSAPGMTGSVQRGLRALAGERLIVAGSEQDIEQLRQALRPAAQASALFAVIGALLGFLLAFNAILMTVPERREAIADLRLAGTRRSAIVQLTMFQALCLGVIASAVGVGVGYALSRSVFGQSTGYLAEAFALNTGTVVPLATVLAAAAGGVAMTCLASSVPLADLRSGRPADAIYLRHGAGANTLGAAAQRRLLAGALALLALASVLFALAPQLALVAAVALAIATVLAVPVAFSGVLALARWTSASAPRMSTLAVALGGVRGTTLRSIALAATGAVALFGSVALGGARSDLLSGIRGFASAYASDAPLWVGEPGDNQATGRLAGDGGAARIRALPEVASVQPFQGSFMTWGPRRVWVIARPPGAAARVLETQTLGGAGAAALASTRLAQGGWIAVSRQIADERDLRVGGPVRLPTPAGPVDYRLAALTSNLAWSPGVVFMSSADYGRAWGVRSPSALAVHVAPGARRATVAAEIRRALAPAGGLEVVSAQARQASIDALTDEGLSQLGTIATLLIATAILALAAALASSIHQRRGALASLRLAGAPPARLRRILLVEASLMLAAGCVTGAVAGIYGQVVIDAYLRHVTGFPAAAAGTSVRPVEIFVLVVGAALAAVALPVWLASKVSPTLALAEEQ